jgi:cold shock CspA family protein
LIISDHSGEDSYLFLEINREDMKNLKQNDIVKFKVQDNRAVSRH